MMAAAPMFACVPMTVRSVPSSSSIRFTRGSREVICFPIWTWRRRSSLPSHKDNEWRTDVRSMFVFVSIRKKATSLLLLHLYCVSMWPCFLILLLLALWLDQVIILLYTFFLLYTYYYICHGSSSSEWRPTTITISIVLGHRRVPIESVNCCCCPKLQVKLCRHFIYIYIYFLFFWLLFLFSIWKIWRAGTRLWRNTL
jgi:hypothetical protein